MKQSFTTPEKFATGSAQRTASRGRNGRLIGFLGAFSLFMSTMILSGCESAVDAEENSAEASDNKPALVSEVEKASYLIGHQQLNQMIDNTLGVLDQEAYLAGVRDAVAKAESQVPEAETETIFQAFSAAIKDVQDQKTAALADISKTYLAEVATREGVTKLESGLLYEVLVEGDGPKPTATDRVVTHYHGTLPNGEVFDSSVDRGTPATFGVSGVIAGWTEALQLMPVGSKWRLHIPSNLAYGERGAGQMIGPNQALVFEVELLEIQTK